MKRSLSPFEIVIGIATIIACIAAVLVVPEVRQRLGLDPMAIALTPTPPNQDLQFVLLRGSCRSEYLVNANEPILIYYGGWSIKGMELAQQWTSALDVTITVDGSPISGEQHAPVEELPLNCKEDQEDIYWLYYTTIISKLSPGVHEISVTFNIRKSLSDGLESEIYPLGEFEEFTFTVTAK